MPYWKVTNEKTSMTYRVAADSGEEAIDVVLGEYDEIDPMDELTAEPEGTENELEDEGADLAA